MHEGLIIVWLYKFRYQHISASHMPTEMCVKPKRWDGQLACMSFRSQTPHCRLTAVDSELWQNYAVRCRLVSYSCQVW